MDWISTLNQAIAYMEEHMTEEIDFVKVAKIARCSSYHFQRMFVYIANVSLTEYIRRRKMTLAAVDLQSGDKKIIDVALKYGYSSPTAFNRAFQTIHGVAPSRIKEKGITLKSYPPISFQLVAKGVEKMEFRIEDKDAIRVLGISKPLAKEFEKAREISAGLWMKVVTEGALKDDDGNIISYGNEGSLLDDLRKIRNAEPEGILGILTYGYGYKRSGKEEFENYTFEDCKYFVGVPSTNPQGKFEEYIIPAHTWAIFPGKGFYSGEGHADALDKRIYTEWLPTSGYMLNGEFEVEFALPVPLNEDNAADIENSPFEIWIPVKKI